MKRVNAEDLINGWLKYHGTTLEEVKKNHPEWEENPSAHTREFYQTYQVTQEQHDQWLKWAKKYTKEVTEVKGKMFEMVWSWVYLDVAPRVKE